MSERDADHEAQDVETETAPVERPGEDDDVIIVDGPELSVQELMAAHAKERRALVREIARLRAQDKDAEPMRLFTKAEVTDLVRRELARRTVRRSRLIAKVVERTVTQLTGRGNP
jgi:hypothetical protein